MLDEKKKENADHLYFDQKHIRSYNLFLLVVQLFGLWS
jgi:hypothetical protein